MTGADKITQSASLFPNKTGSRGKSFPTVDLYFKQSCRDWIENGMIRQISQNVFETDDHLIAIRHDQGVCRNRYGKRLIYLVDDDVGAAIRSSSVPARYRAKLLIADLKAMRRLEDQAEHIVTTSSVLQKMFLRKFPEKEIALLPPAWPIENLPIPLRNHNPLRIALLMGLTHAKDAKPLFAGLEKMVMANKQVSLTVSDNLAPPKAWKSNPRIEVVPVMSWRDYQKWLKTRRFDVWLYPQFSDGAFNRARSANKLGEAGQVGAALVASQSWLAGSEARKSGRCLLIESKVTSWIEAIENLLEARGQVYELASTNRRALLEENAPLMQHRFWARLLGFPANSAQTDGL